VPLLVQCSGRANTFLRMDKAEIRAWFDQYLNVLAALGRGETDDLRAVLGYYGVPLLVATDDAVHALTAEDNVIGFAGQQVEAMRATRVHRIKTMAYEITALNANAVLYRGDFARQRSDGSEVARLRVTYLITNGEPGVRVSVAVIHTPG
jgi:hypothetical protein